MSMKPVFPVSKCGILLRSFRMMKSLWELLPGEFYVRQGTGASEIHRQVRKAPAQDGYAAPRRRAWNRSRCVRGGQRCCRGNCAPGGGLTPPPRSKPLYCFVNTIVFVPLLIDKLSVSVLLSELRL